MPRYVSDILCVLGIMTDLCKLHASVYRYVPNVTALTRCREIEGDPWNESQLLILVSLQT